MRAKLSTNRLYALILLALAAPAARADFADDAWECASTVVEGVGDMAETGAKALRFIATPSGGVCVTRLGTPMTLAPISLVLAAANAGVLHENCSATLYDAAAKPIAYSLRKVLGEMNALPSEANDVLTKIVTDQLTGEALKHIPSITVVTGSLTCGCDLYDAGLSIETIKRVLNTAERVANACGGPVWAATKKIAGAVVEISGDAIESGVLAASNMGDFVAGQDKNISNTAYYDEYWKANVEDFATAEFKSPGAWHNGKNWQALWGPCVTYFDTHTLSEENSQNVCDDMRSGINGSLGKTPQYFEGNAFTQHMFRRVFEFDVTGVVEAARKQAYIDYADMKTGMVVPQEIVDDQEAYISITTRSHAERPKIMRASIDAVFGIPTKEKIHDGLAVANSTPPTTWDAGTVGARSFDFYEQVKGDGYARDQLMDGGGRADAAKAVQLAMDDMGAEEQVRGKAAELMLVFYKTQWNGVLTGRRVVASQAQGQVDSMIAGCPSPACRDTIATEWEACSAATEAFAAENASAIANFDSPQGQSARSEYASRGAACLDQARTTSRAARFQEMEGPPVPTQLPTPRCGPGQLRCPGVVPVDAAPAESAEDDAGSRTEATASPNTPQRYRSAAGQDRAASDGGPKIPHKFKRLAIPTTPELPDCRALPERGMWVCAEGEAMERCDAAVERGDARSCSNH